MYGVILWSDPDGGEAVIWCEDCGKLAYYQVPEGSAYEPHTFFDPGDYVEFDIAEDESLRRARNATMINSGSCPRETEAQHRSDATQGRSVGPGTGQVVKLSAHPLAGKRTRGGLSHPD